MKPIWFATSIDDYEIRNNTIILKENNNIVYEYPIPKDYKIIKISSDGFLGSRHCFVMSTYTPKKPKYIPEGFTNLTLSEEGLYCVNDANKDTLARRTYYYMDTSIITPDSFERACARKYTVTEKDIPKNFWFSIDFRNYLCETTGRIDYITLKEVPSYLNSFDPRSRLITEYEEICIEAFNGLGSPDPVSYAFFQLPDKYLFNTKKGFFIGGAFINNENWDKVVTSMENPNIYLLAYGEKNIDDLYCTYSSHICYKDEEKLYPYFVIPVLEEEKLKKRVKK